MFFFKLKCLHLYPLRGLYNEGFKMYETGIIELAGW